MTTRAVVSVDCQNIIGQLKHIWASIGFDEINASYTERGKNLLKVLKDNVIQTPYYVRNHNAFTSGNLLSYPLEGSTNIYREDEQGNPIYSFDIIDRIYDSFIENNFLPIIELNFMPYDLVPKQYQSNYDLNGWSYPPKDYQKWYNLIQAFINHLTQRYGQQIENWYFEVWNEPNVEKYWSGTCEDYCKLYDYSVEAIKSINPNLKVGGPATADSGAQFLDQFLQHITSGINYVTKQNGTSIDFISFHSKGAYYNPIPSYGHSVPFQTPSVTKMLNQITTSLNVINKYSTLNNVPIFVDECDPAAGYRNGIYDNANYIVCNTEYYPSIVAAIIYNILPLSRVKLITHWAFYLEGKRMFEGNRTLITNYDIYLPILNGLKLIEKLKTEQYAIQITNNTIPLNGFCTFDQTNSNIQLLLFSHLDDYTVYNDQDIKIILNNIKLKKVLVTHYKIDVNNNNTYTEWIKMGKPAYLNDEQIAYFKNYEQLKVFNPPMIYQIENNQLILDIFSMLTHSIDFFDITNLD